MACYTSIDDLQDSFEAIFDPFIDFYTMFIISDIQVNTETINPGYSISL